MKARQVVSASDRPSTAFGVTQRLKRFAFGLSDQGMSAGSMFILNVVLARTQTKEEYGAFALAYSIFMFLLGLYTAAVLEPFTVYAAGRYQSRFASYWRLMLRASTAVGLTIAMGIAISSQVILRFDPALREHTLLGLALSIPFIFSGTFLRRTFYVLRRPASAAATSAMFMVLVGASLWFVITTNRLSGFSAFVILALSWLVASGVSLGLLSKSLTGESFLSLVPDYWREHWIYARWVLATAMIYQFLHQGYYWLVAGFLSVREVGELKALYVLVAPVEQFVVSLSFLTLPALAARYEARRRSQFRSLWRSYGLALAAITGLFAIALRAVGAPVLHRLYSGKFDGLESVLYVLALVPLVMAFGNSTSDAIRAAERPKLMFYALVASAIATLAIGMPLVKFLGLRGAAWGMVLSAATYSVALLVAFRISVDRASAFSVRSYGSPSVPPLEEGL